jgi:hypothetical protein
VPWSYQLKNWPLGGWRSIRSSVAIVLESRSTVSRRLMIPSSRATMALHM